MIEVMSIILIMLLITVCIFGVIALIMYLTVGARAFSDKYCQRCDTRMLDTGRLAHGFKRLYECPLCNWSTYIEDKILKKHRLQEIKMEQGNKR